MDDNISERDSSFSSKCRTCNAVFPNVQECLQHELLKHIIGRKKNARAKSMISEAMLNEQKRLNNVLKNCKSGNELEVIFELLCLNKETLECILDRIQTCFLNDLKTLGFIEIYPYGSIANGLALRDCDIDIYIEAPNVKLGNISLYNRITKLLRHSPNFYEVFAVRRAKVPIIKCKHNDTGFSIDVNVSCPNSIANTQFIYNLVQSDKRIRELMLFLKIWAKNMEIIKLGSFSSYCFINIIIFFLQQPRNISPTNNDGRILKSIKELQANCPPHIVQGVNYAYNLDRPKNKPNIPADVTSWTLIQEFFDFYAHFKFDDYIISPYYGKAIKKTNFKDEVCEQYWEQFETVTNHAKGITKHLDIEHCVCVQDAFYLIQNTARSMSQKAKRWFLLRLQTANRMCKNPNNLPIAELYEVLLFGIVVASPKVSSSTSDVPSTCNNGNVLSHLLLPSRSNLCTLATVRDMICIEEVLPSWCQLYLEAIETIVSRLFRIDIQKQFTTESKQLKLESDSVSSLNQMWTLSFTVDLWSKRCFKKNTQKSFIADQLEQTEYLYNARRQLPEFSLTLNTNLKLSVLPNYEGIEIKLYLPEGLTIMNLNKKNPIRKFFNILKTTLQCCDLKNVLEMSNSSKESAEVFQSAKASSTIAETTSVDKTNAVTICKK